MNSIFLQAKKPQVCVSHFENLLFKVKTCGSEKGRFCERIQKKLSFGCVYSVATKHIVSESYNYCALLFFIKKR